MLADAFQQGPRPVGAHGTRASKLPLTGWGLAKIASLAKRNRARFVPAVVVRNNPVAREIDPVRSGASMQRAAFTYIEPMVPTLAARREAERNRKATVQKALAGGLQHMVGEAIYKLCEPIASLEECEEQGDYGGGSMAWQSWANSAIAR